MKTSTIAKITASLFFGFNALAGQAQTQPGKVAGTVKDSLNQQVLPYATILLKKYEDAAFLQAVVTDEKGAFQFSNLGKGFYFLTADYLGYKKVKVDSLQVASSAESKRVMVIMPQDAKLLKAVTVTGYKPFIEQQNNKLVLNVENSPLAAGSTTDEVIARAPGVVEANGGFQVRGKNALVLIDGRSTNLTGEDLKNYLNSLPANGVSKVEVMANPSAKYDAAGGSVINIVTTKSKNYGTNGTLTTGLGMGEKARYNAGLSLNHRTQKLNVYGSLDRTHSQPFTTITSDRALSAESRVQENTADLKTIDNNSLKAGLDYEFSKKTSAGVLVRAMVNEREREGLTNSRIAQGAAPLASSQVSTNGNSLVVSPSVNVYYRTVLDSVGTELRLAADYFSYGKDLKNQFQTSYFDANGAENQPDMFLRDNSPAGNSVQTVTADITRPLKNGTLEAGLKTTFTKTDNDIFWEGRTAEQDWTVDAGKTNHFIYRENINAAYASYSTKIKDLSLQVGLRAEQTNTKGTSVTLGQTNPNSYFHLFPSVSGQYKLSEKQEIGVSYRKKIDRFRFDIVNPFVTYISQYSYAQGNPNVQPSISHNFELSHSYNNEWFSALSYGRHLNVLSEVVKPLEGTKATIHSFANFSAADQWSGSVTHAKGLFSGKWNASNTVGFLYANVHGPAAQFSQANVAFMVSSNNTFQLGKGFKAEVFVNYTSPLTFGAFAFKANYGGNLGLSKSVLNNQGTLTLNVADVFNTRTQRYSTDSYGIQALTENKTESRVVRLNFSYRFGNKNVKASKNRRTGVEEEKMRMESNQ
ncbi:TonB-dependent receptor [Nibribacter ruber]|uniref:TonB-dependent receptor n=1 Tax=Nibribacter ruber TaxID=2698458 RepID=A0A6P1P3X9_9BACT|nr:outer membrane beta-barrel protein [Nibribacter ruber]QHL89139.1 TonB-dependent receptor [Nibribacter ruber]